MNEGELRKYSKKAGEIANKINSCFERHSSTLYNMKEDEIQSYEAELKDLTQERWVSEKYLKEAKEEILNGAVWLPSGEIKDVYSTVEVLIVKRQTFVKWFGDKE